MTIQFVDKNGLKDDNCFFLGGTQERPFFYTCGYTDENRNKTIVFPTLKCRYTDNTVYPKQNRINWEPSHIPMSYGNNLCLGNKGTFIHYIPKSDRRAGSVIHYSVRPDSSSYSVVAPDLSTCGRIYIYRPNAGSDNGAYVAYQPALTNVLALDSDCFTECSCVTETGTDLQSVFDESSRDSYMPMSTFWLKTIDYINYTDRFPDENDDRKIVQGSSYISYTWHLLYSIPTELYNMSKDFTGYNVIKSPLHIPFVSRIESASPRTKSIPVGDVYNTNGTFKNTDVGALCDSKVLYEYNNRIYLLATFRGDGSKLVDHSVYHKCYSPLIPIGRLVPSRVDSDGHCIDIWVHSYVGAYRLYDTTRSGPA